MRRLSTRVFSIVLALVLCFGLISVGATKVSAAVLPSVTITPQVTESVNEQAFVVQTPVDSLYYAYYGNVLAKEGTVSAGTDTLKFDTDSVVNLQVFAPYTTDSGKTNYVKAYSTSSNAYWVDVFCKAENGTVLKQDRIKLSKFNEPEAVYNAPAVIDRGAVEYHAINSTVLFKYGDSSKTITYTEVPKEAKTVIVKYVDDLDAEIYSETLVLNYGDTAEITAPATYTVGDATYNLKKASTYNVTFENAQSVYTYEYAKQAPAAQLPYNITIQLVDENGALLHTMQKGVDVGKQVTVNLPATYEVGLKLYALAEGQEATIVRDYASTDAKAYVVKYVLVSETEAYDVTINLVDRATGNVLDTVTGTVEPDGVPFTYDIATKNSLQKDGVTYWVITGQGNSKGKIVHAYGDSTTAYNLYYSAKKDSIPESYVVTQRFICVNDNVVLETKTQTVAVNSSVTFEEAPETLKIGNKEYIRLNGQDGETIHKYNDAQTVYEIYYHDSSIVVDKDDVIYVPGETEPPIQPETPGEPNPPAEPETPAEPEAPEVEPETPAEPETPEVEPETPAVEPETPTTEPETPTEPEEPTAPSEDIEIIDEPEVPLASGPADIVSDGDPSVAPYVAGGIGLIAIIVLAIVFISKKRRTA